jgi:hypothetical protein
MPIKKSEFDRKGDRGFGFAKPPGVGTRKQKDVPPDKEILKQLGGTGKKAPIEGRRAAGNTEVGFIQNTPKKATSHGGMAPPAKKAAKTSTSHAGRKQFGQPRGKTPF